MASECGAAFAASSAPEALRERWKVAKRTPSQALDHGGRERAVVTRRAAPGDHQRFHRAQPSAREVEADTNRREPRPLRLGSTRATRGRASRVAASSTTRGPNHRSRRPRARRVPRTWAAPTKAADGKTSTTTAATPIPLSNPPPTRPTPEPCDARHDAIRRMRLAPIVIVVLAMTTAERLLLVSHVSGARATPLRPRHRRAQAHGGDDVHRLAGEACGRAARGTARDRGRTRNRQPSVSTAEMSA